MIGSFTNDRKFPKIRKDQFVARERLPTNLRRIRDRQAPILDEIWLKHNPQHAGYLDDKLIHHHIDQGRMASGLPETIHQELFDLLHRRTLD